MKFVLLLPLLALATAHHGHAKGKAGKEGEAFLQALLPILMRMWNEQVWCTFQ